MAQPRKRPSARTSAAAIPQKRGAASVTPLRQSKRAASGTSSVSKTTPKKSEYFEQESEHSEPDSESGADDASDFDDEASSSLPSETEEDSEDAYDTDEHPKRRRSGGGRAKPVPKPEPASVRNGKLKGGELWREGAKIDAAPGEEVYIALPKARGPGSTPYRDDALHPNTMLFLGDLKKNNNRPWLKAHDPDFRQAQRDFASFVDAITSRLIEVDDTLPELPSKDLVFRIYRDVRFSKDPTPYKTHFSAAWSRTGRKGGYAHYYVQIAPGQCFVGGGKWMPENPVLQQLREDVTDNPERIRRALTAPEIRQHYLNGVKDQADDAIAVFRNHNKENAFKRTPKVWKFAHALI